MADSAALRSRRCRAHARGDHSLCRHGPLLAAVAAPLPTLPGAGPHAAPWDRMEALAGRLEAAHEADPGNALLARELRATLLALGGGESDAALDCG